MPKKQHGNPVPPGNRGRALGDPPAPVQERVAGQAWLYSDADRAAEAMLEAVGPDSSWARPIADRAADRAAEAVLDWEPWARPTAAYGDQARAEAEAGPADWTMPDGRPPGARRHTMYADSLRDRGIGTLGSAPEVRTPADVAALRTWLVEQWRPGRPYAQSADVISGFQGGGRPGDYARSEMVMLQRASLWHVAGPMVDLLAAVAPTTPGDVRWPDLPDHGDSGLVVFARPLPGADAVDPDRAIWVNAILWGHGSLPAYRGRGPLRVLTVSSYRLVDFDVGLTGTELHVTQATGAFAYGNARPSQAVPAEAGRSAFDVTGTAWVPLGRSDWPWGDPVDAPVWPDQAPAAVASYAEDRRLLAALWTLLEQRGVAERAEAIPPRPVRRNAERAGVAAPASTVTVVTLRNPRRAPSPDRQPGQPPVHSHRWVVREHLRWQACGPGRAERRLTLIRPYVKGPADAPLVVKTRVHAWVR